MEPRLKLSRDVTKLGKEGDVHTHACTHARTHTQREGGLDKERSMEDTDVK